MLSLRPIIFISMRHQRTLFSYTEQHFIPGKWRLILSRTLLPTLDTKVHFLSDKHKTSLTSATCIVRLCYRYFPVGMRNSFLENIHSLWQEIKRYSTVSAACYMSLWVLCHSFSYTTFFKSAAKFWQLNSVIFFHQKIPCWCFFPTEKSKYCLQ